MGLATGHLDEAGFVLAGPAPLYAAGLIGVFRGPGRRVAFWLLAGGALFAVGDCLAGAVTDLPAVADRWHGSCC